MPATATSTRASRAAKKCVQPRPAKALVVEAEVEVEVEVEGEGERERDREGAEGGTVEGEGPGANEDG
jgi:hypothetical protein